MDDETFKKIAKADMIVRLFTGVIAGIIGITIGIVLIVFSIMKQMPELIGCGIALAAIGLFTSSICGYFVFSRYKNKKVEK